MSMLYLAQPDQHQQLEWLDGGTLSLLLDGKATDGQLMMGRFDVRQGEALPFHKHLREDEVFMLIAGTAIVWYDDQEHAPSWRRTTSSILDSSPPEARMRVRFIRPANTADAIASHLPTLQPFASELVPALRETTAVERGRSRAGERS